MKTIHMRKYSNVKKAVKSDYILEITNLTNFVHKIFTNAHFANALSKFHIHPFHIDKRLLRHEL